MCVCFCFCSIFVTANSRFRSKDRSLWEWNMRAHFCSSKIIWKIPAFNCHWVEIGRFQEEIDRKKAHTRIDLIAEKKNSRRFWRDIFEMTPVSDFHFNRATLNLHTFKITHKKCHTLHRYCYYSSVEFNFRYFFFHSTRSVFIRMRLLCLFSLPVNRLLLNK